MRQIYTEEQKQQAIIIAKQFGWVHAAKQLGINKLSVRCWVDPVFAEEFKQQGRENYYKNSEKQNKRNAELKKLKRQQKKLEATNVPST